MPIYTAVFSGVATGIATPQDVFEITTGTESRVSIREIRIGQFSDFGDAQAEILEVSILRGPAATFASGSGGTSATPVNLGSWSRAATAAVEVNNTTLAVGGTPDTALVDIFNVAAGWWYYPPDAERIHMDSGANAERLVVRMTGAADDLTLSGTIVFEEGALTAPGVTT